jgi:hypothetical protein
MTITTQRPPLWITAALVLTLFGFWLFALDWLHMRPDEHLVYQHTDGTLIEAVVYQATRDVQAPLWHSFFWTWRHLLVGDSEFVGRYQGVLWSVLTVALVVRLMTVGFGEARYGWLAALGVGVNAYFVTYAFEIRPYPIVMLSATFSAWRLWRWWGVPTVRNALWYGLSLALMAYIHYFMAFWAAAQVGWVLLGRPTRRHWRTLPAALGLALLLWSPWLPTFIRQVNTLRAIDGALGIASTTTDTTWAVVFRWLNTATSGLWPLWLLAAVALLWAKPTRARSLLLWWAFGVPTIAFSANLFANVYDPRYISYTALGFGLLLGAGLAALPVGRWRYAVAVGLVALMVVRLPDYLPQRLPYRTIYQTVSNESRPDDQLILFRADHNSDYVRWLIDQYTAPHLLDDIALAPYQVTGRRVWFVTSDPAHFETQDFFRLLEATRPLTRVVGQCNADWCYVAQLMEGAPNAEPTPLVAPNGDTLNYDGGEVVRVDRHTLRVRTWWDAPDVLARDYSLSVRLLDANGALVVQSDSPPVAADGTPQPTSALRPNVVVLDDRPLSLRGLPAGTYTVAVVAYHPLDGDTLAHDGHSTLTVDTVTLP